MSPTVRSALAPNRHVSGRWVPVHLSMGAGLLSLQQCFESGAVKAQHAPALRCAGLPCMRLAVGPSCHAARHGNVHTRSRIGVQYACDACTLR